MEKYENKCVSPVTKILWMHHYSFRQSFLCLALWYKIPMFGRKEWMGP